MFVFLHTVAYSFSVGQLLMYYAAKMLESTGIVIFVNWLFTFFVAISAEFMMKGLGIGKMCLMFSVCLGVCVVILMKGIPSESQIEGSSSLKQPLKIKLKPEEFEMYMSEKSTVGDERSVQNDF